MRAMHRLAAAAAVALAGLSTASAGMLVNESFENVPQTTTLNQVYYGYNDNTVVPGWNFYPGSSGYGGGTVGNGTSFGAKDGSIYFSLDYGVLATSSGARPSVSAGEVLNLSLLYGTNGSWYATQVFADYFDASGNAVSSVQVMNLNSGDPAAFSLQTSSPFTVPDNAAKIGIRFVGPAAWSPGIHVDNVQLTSVPEPATLGLLGGLGVLLARRNRKA